MGLLEVLKMSHLDFTFVMVYDTATLQTTLQLNI